MPKEEKKKRFPAYISVQKNLVHLKIPTLSHPITFLMVHP